MRFTRIAVTDTLQLTLSTHDGLLVAAPAGELDLASAARILAALIAETGDAERVVIDLSRLAFIDCAGVSALRAFIAGRPEHSTAVLFSAAGQVGRLLSLIGFAAPGGEVSRVPVDPGVSGSAPTPPRSLPGAEPQVA